MKIDLTMYLPTPARAASLLAMLLLSLPPAQAQAVPDAQVSRGQRLFMRCSACHDVGDAKLAKIGPHLKGVLGRRVASQAGFNYSAALKAQTFTWDEAHLLQWLERPSSVAPGTNMVFEGLPSEADRKALLAYLATQR